MLKVSDKVSVNYNKLKQNFEEAKKDKLFQSYISRIKLADDILMKYTSSLMDSCLEFNNCLNCKHISECKNKIIGYACLPKVTNKKIDFNYKACRYKVEDSKKNIHLKNVRYFDLPNNLKEASWDQVDFAFAKRQETILWLSEFLKNYPKTDKGLYLTGSFGSGKTFLITAMFNELAKENVKSAIIFWPEFLRNLKASFDSDYDEKFEYVKKVPLLLIDDLGAETVTPWSRDEILCSILQYRMDAKLPTFITSNLTIEELTDHLAETKRGSDIVKANRIIERIKQLTEEIKLISKNMRSKQI